MIDPQIRARLVAMPEEYRAATNRLIVATEQLLTAKLGRDDHETLAVARATADGVITGTNEGTRKVQRDAVLATDETYQALADVVRGLETRLKIAQTDLDALKFERDILITVANNDHAVVFPTQTVVSP